MVSDELDKLRAELLGLIGNCVSGECIGRVFGFFESAVNLIIDTVNSSVVFFNVFELNGFTYFEEKWRDVKRGIDENINIFLNNSGLLDELSEVNDCFREVDLRCLDSAFLLLYKIYSTILAEGVSSFSLGIYTLFRRLGHREQLRLLSFAKSFLDDVNIINDLAIFSNFIENLKQIDARGNDIAEPELNLLGQILVNVAEGFYRKILNFLIYLLVIMDRNKRNYMLLELIDKGKLLTIGKAFRELRRYSRAYPFIGEIIHEDIRVFRNAFVHNDFRLNPHEKCIIVRGKGREIVFPTSKVSNLVSSILRIFSHFIILIKYLPFEIELIERIKSFSLS